ncbi:hypothetical protein D3C77_632050 [compost metagenome]
MPLSLIEDTVFNNYLIPGIMLFSVLGVIPLIIATGLIRRWDWRLAEKLNVFSEKYWAWTFSLYSGFALIIWITIQAYIIHTFSAVHLIYIILGLMIQIATLLPGAQKKYKK